MKHKIENPSVLEKNNEVYLNTLRFKMRDLASANLLAIVLGRHTVEVECVCAEKQPGPNPEKQLSLIAKLAGTMQTDTLTEAVKILAAEDNFSVLLGKYIGHALHEYHIFNGQIGRRPVPPRIDPDNITASKIRAGKEAKP